MQTLHFFSPGEKPTSGSSNSGGANGSTGRRLTPIEANMFDSLARKYRNWRTYQNTVSELSRLTTRELDDLGIARGDISFVARRASR
jgi:uncharacterized protein YjiS (DUF1127 family)